MSQINSKSSDAMHIARFTGVPSYFIIFAHAFNYWALDLIALALSFLSIKYFWTGNIEFLNNNPERVTPSTKKVHYFFSISCTVITIILIYFGEEIESYFSIEMGFLILGNFLLTFFFSIITYWYLFNIEEGW